MTNLEARIQAETNRAVPTVSEALYKPGQEVRNLLILEVIFNRIPWMWSYKVSTVDGQIKEVMEWAI